MEECKIKAREAGLKFDDGTLEYIVTNSDLLELRPKFMIPTMYDYWVHELGNNIRQPHIRGLPQ